MSVVLDMLVPAAALSCAAVACLAALPNAPAGWRLGFAVGGLGAWLVPWPWIELPLNLPGLRSLAAEVPVVAILSPAAAQTLPSNDLLAYVLLALTVPGIALFAADWINLRRSLAGWTRTSRSGESLRALLPPALRSTRARIRVISGARVAAAVGLIRPTVWVGDGFTDAADLRLALVHECWHVRRLDPLWIAVLAAVRRLYWWNPLVARLVTECEVLIEAACDRRCIGSLGRESYLSRLAALMIDADLRGSPRLAAAVHGRNVQRLKLLQAHRRLRLRDRFLVAAVTACGALVTGYSVAKPIRPVVERSVASVPIPGTRAGAALAAVLREIDGGDLELVQSYFGAYTPQEVAFERDDWLAGLELVEVAEGGDGLSVEFVVRDAGGKRRQGTLRVADSAAIQVIGSEFRDLAESEGVHP